jgi:hypothetical protein
MLERVTSVDASADCLGRCEIVIFTVLAQPTVPLLPDCAKTVPFVVIGIKKKIAAVNNIIPRSIGLRLLLAFTIKFSILCLLLIFIQRFTLAYIKELFTISINGVD